MQGPTPHRSPLDGTCLGLVVVDPGGLSLASLRDTDPRSVSAGELLALTAGHGLPSGLVEAPVGDPAGPRDVICVSAPVVLRVQGGGVLAWSDAAGGYVALDRGDLDLLVSAPDGRTVDDLPGPDAGRRVGVLAALGILEVESAVEPVPAEFDPEPEAAPDLEANPGGTPSVALKPLLADLPSGAAAAKVLAYRLVGRVRRLASGQSIRSATGSAPVPEHVAVALPGPEATAPGPIDPERSVPSAPVVAESEPTRARWQDQDHRTPVFAVYHSPEHNANLGLGLIMAHARTVDHGSLNDAFDLRRARIDAEPMLDELARRGRHAIVLFSDYMWSIDHNLAVSAAVKRLNPRSITVHGGPHAPKYEADAEAFFRDHAHVDVLVRGEGELTIAALLAALGPDPDPDRLGDRLGDVEGLTFRDGPAGSGVVVRTSDRERATDMARFPSPYLTGEFDDIDPARWRSATVETNRGCPYGCTFCDWGTATLSRIRQFPQERVEAELEWLAARGISEVFLADANFGLFARDVEIARTIADLKRRYGAPVGVICSFAKNTTKHTAEIVKIWVDAGICAEGSVALQTTDPVTLRNVKRSNIKVEKYDDLAEEFRSHKLPIVTDLLMGLPGSTVESFKNDLQRCIDQEVTPRMMETVVLPNSPMNDPAYREEFAIVTDESNIVVSTSSYSRDDFDEMLRLRLLFRSLEHYGLLRHLFRWLQREHGIRALDLVHDIDRAIIEDPERYPLLTWVGRYFDLVTVPPGGWTPFYDEVIELLEARHGVAWSPAMGTVIAVQEFLMPTRQRQFPDSISLDHDYVTWYRFTSGDGTDVRLADLGPGELIVDDPAGVCDARLLRNQFSIRRLEACDNPFWVLNDWELQSDLARPMGTAIGVLSS